MFDNFFGGDDDNIVEEIVELAVLEELLECGNCRGRCNCGYQRQAPVQRGYGQPVQRQQRLLNCGNCYGTCGCAGYDPFGNLIRMEIAMEEAEIIGDIIGDIF